MLAYSHSIGLLLKLCITYLGGNKSILIFSKVQFRYLILMWYWKSPHTYIYILCVRKENRWNFKSRPKSCLPILTPYIIFFHLLSLISFHFPHAKGEGVKMPHNVIFRSSYMPVYKITEQIFAEITDRPMAKKLLRYVQTSARTLGFTFCFSVHRGRFY